ncbi:hypothetical protein ACQUSR_19090 [Streptomyces sp. P1-3]|uniref:hypothetical protein n=1 Tax=Streptomyces sp. P1-3 TaxID=3421658 RepID=UPI003D35C752
MADPEIQAQQQRATQLRALANHIDSLVSKPNKYSTETMKKWAGPNATQVRGDLAGWKTKCHTVAEALRTAAKDADKAAEDASKPKK